MSPTAIRRLILEQSKRAHIGHIGSSLSIADLVAALYDHGLCIDHPDDAERDRFVLSKGHAVLAVYVALYLQGWMSKATLDTFCTDGTLLGVHPEHQLRGIDFSTGSLGQGLSMGVGAALAARFQKSSRRTFVLMSDAECNEGAVWEAVMFAAHHKLSNLTVMIDLNGQQAMGYTEDVISMGPMAARWRAFGWDVHEVDGHDVDAMGKAMQRSRAVDAPHVLVAHTTFGKGVSYMENQIKWHYWPMDDAEYAQALHEVEGVERREALAKLSLWSETKPETIEVRERSLVALAH